MAAERGLLVIGQGPAGTAAATAFRERQSGWPVLLVDEEGVSCYARPRLPEVVAGRATMTDLCLHPLSWYDEHGIQLVRGRRAVRLRTDTREVELDDGRRLAYDRLVLATGADAAVPPIPGLPADRVTVLRTAQDAAHVREWAQGKTSAVLIGGGLLGLEAGYSLCRLGLTVTVVEIAPRLLPRQTDDEGSALLQKKLAPLGFRFILGVRTTHIASRDGRVTVQLDNGTSLTADLALISAGIRPRVELARAAGLTLGRAGVVVDDALATSAAGVWAAGDVAEWRGQVAGLWSAAMAMGRIAGENAAGGSARYEGWVPSTKLKVVGVEVWSQGEIAPPDARVMSRSDENQGTLTKLFLRHGRLVGSLQIGDTRHWQFYQRLMQQGEDLTGREDTLFNPGAEWSMTTESGETPAAPERRK